MAANWVQLAQAGDSEAIAALMNASLGAIGVQARAAVREGNLHILLESERLLTPRSCAEFIQRGIERLGLGWVSAAIVYSRAPGQPTPHWIERVELATVPMAENPFILSPQAALEESYLSFKPPFINWRRVRLFDLLLLSVPMLVVLTSVYIWNRYLGPGTIVPPPAVPVADVFQIAQSQALRAHRETQAAKLQDKREWREITAEWRQARDLMQAVPASHPKYAIAQQKIQEYEQNAKTLTDLKLAGSEMVLKRVIENGIAARSLVLSELGVFAPTGPGHTIAVLNPEEDSQQQISAQVELSRFGYPYPGTQTGSPVAAAVTEKNRSLWVANDQTTGEGLRGNNDETCTPANSQAGFLYHISTETQAIDRAVQVGASPKQVAATTDNGYVLASNWCSWDVSVVDTQKYQEVRRLQVGAYPRGIAIGPQFAYVAVQGANAIAAIDLKDFSVSRIPEVGQAPHQLALDSAGKFLYVSLIGEGQVAKLDLGSRTIVGKVAAGNAPRSLALSDNGTFLYVINYGSDTVSKIRTQDMQVVQTVAVSSAPIALAYDAKTHQVWVGSTSGSIQVFQD